MLCCGTSVVLLATLALCSPAPSNHDQYVDELLQHLQAAYGRKPATQDASYDGGRHFASREIQEPRANEENEQRTGFARDNVGDAMKRADNYNGVLKGRPNAFFSRQHTHAPQLGRLQQSNEIKPRAEEADYERSSSKRQVDRGLGHVLNKANNYGAPSNSRRDRDVPELAELQESADVKVAGKLGHVLNKENNYGMPPSNETQPAALTANDGTREPDNETRDSVQHGTQDAAMSAERRATFWKLLPDKIYKPKHRVHRSV